MRDALLSFGEINFATTNLPTGVSGQVGFPDQIDVGGVANDIGKGELLQVEFTCETAITADYHVFQAAALMTNNLVGVVAALQGGTADVIVRSGDIAAAGATSIINTGNFRWLECQPGLKFYMPIPAMPRNQGYDLGKRYLAIALNSIVGTAAVATGRLSAQLVLSGQQDHTYQGGFSVT